MDIVRSCGGRCSVGKVICVMREMGQHHEIHDYRVSLESRYVGFRSSTSCQQLQSEDEDITLGVAIIGYSQLLTSLNSCLNSFGMPPGNSFAASQSRPPSQPQSSIYLNTSHTKRANINQRSRNRVCSIPMDWLTSDELRLQGLCHTTVKSFDK